MTRSLSTNALPRLALTWRTLALGVALAVAGVAYVLTRPSWSFPSDQTPEGAYMRVAQAVTSAEPRAFFAYLETEAQWACYTLRDARKSARARVLASYPEPRRSELAKAHGALADASDGSDVFALLYRERQWDRRLRRDLSGVASVDVDAKGERASVVTVRGTRWPFRRRDNGIWGLTIFTAELLAEAEKATRDLAVVEASAAEASRTS